MSSRIPHTIGVDEARSRLSELLAGLPDEPGKEPVVMGAYRRAQGVLVSVKEYETLLEVYEHHLRRRETAAALASVRAEGGEPSEEAITDLERAVEGEITYEEAKERVLERARRWQTTPTPTPEPTSSGTTSASRKQKRSQKRSQKSRANSRS